MTKNASRNKADDYIQREKAFLPAIFVLLLATALPGLIFGQGATGAINGTVTDPTGAVVPGARIILHNVATGAERSAVTNSTGVYVFPDVLPGQYTLQVTKQGFNTTTEKAFTLFVNQTSTHNITLAVGAPTQQVTVSATAIHLEESTAELGTAINQSEVNDLPLNGRNFTQLLDLTPGVSPISTAQNAGGGSGFTGNAIGTFSFPSVNGQGNRSNMFLIDGFNDYGFVGNYAVQPILDSIQEFKVQSHNDIAAYGGALGGIVNVVTKGGSSEYHGDVWEFLRNNAFDARNTFVASTTPYKQNQFGGIIGGPLLPGHFRSGPPKSFFFLGYEGFRSVRSAETPDFFPTPAELSGDLSDISSQAYNPFTTLPDPNNPGQFIRDPFPGNQIPASVIDQPLITYAKLFYLPPEQTGNPAINFFDTTPNRTRMDTANIRFDHQFNDSTSGWVRYTGFTEPSTSATGIPGVLGANFNHGYQAGGAITHTFSGGTKVATFRFGRTSSQANVLIEFNRVPADAWKQGNFSPLFSSDFVGGISLNPGLGIPGYAGIPGGSIQGNHIADVWEYAGDLTMVYGRHTIQVGADFNTNNNTQPILFDSVCFCAFNTSDPENPNATGSALASFLLGVPNSTNRRNVFISTHGGWVDGAYVQDQWKVNSKLMLNFGLRYDVTLWPIYGSLKNHNLYAGDTDLDTGNYILTAMPPFCSSTQGAPCVPGTALPDHVVLTPQKNHAIIHNTYDNWQPRMGLAYRVLPTTVIRGSVGKFYDNWAAIQQLATNYQGTWPDVTFLLAQNLNNPTPQNPTPTVTAQDPLNLGSGAAIFPSPTPFNQVNWMLDPYYKDAYSVQWNFGVQRQLGTNTVIEADYVGSRDSRLDSGSMRNVAVTPGPGNPQDHAPFPYITPTFFDKSIGKATYHAFQFSMRKTTTQGLTYLISYTYSKAENLGCDNFFGSEGCSIQNPYNLRADWSVAGFDVTHMLTASWVYDLPFGAHRKFQSHHRLVNALVGDWSLNGIASFRSGVPYNATSPGGIPNTGNTVEQANIIGPPFMPHPDRNQFLNPASFQNPAPFTFGSEGRNDLRSPGVSNFDLSLFRDFPFTESKKLQFRVDAFNAFNWQALNVPDANVPDTNFGSVTSTAQTERQVQFALKFYW